MIILIADDFAPIRSSVKRMLESIPGVTLVAEAADGIEAAKLLKTLNPDVLVLDVQMPGKTGLVVLQEMGIKTGHPTIIILTNYATPDLRMQCLTLGADYVLDKTMEFHQVVEIVQKLARV